METWGGESKDEPEMITGVGERKMLSVTGCRAVSWRREGSSGCCELLQLAGLVSMGVSHQVII